MAATQGLTMGQMNARWPTLDLGRKQRRLASVCGLAVQRELHYLSGGGGCGCGETTPLRCSGAQFDYKAPPMPFAASYANKPPESSSSRCSPARLH